MTLYKYLNITGLTLISLTACSKKFTQTDLDNARKEGVASAQPSANRLALLKAQKIFAENAKIAIQAADTFQQNLILNKPTNGRQWLRSTEKTIQSALGKTTNTDGAFLGLFGFVKKIRINGKDTQYAKIVMGLDKTNKAIRSGSTNNNSQNNNNNNITGDSINNVDKSVIYTVGGHTFTFTKSTSNSNPVLSTKTFTLQEGQAHFEVYAVRLALDNKLIADNLYTTPAVLSAIQEALVQAIDTTK